MARKRFFVTVFYDIFVFCRSLTAIFKNAKTIVNTSVLCRPVAKNLANTTVFGRWVKKHCKLRCFGHLTFKNLAICSGFCYPGQKHIVKNGILVAFVMFQLVSCFELMIMMMLFLCAMCYLLCVVCSVLCVLCSVFCVLCSVFCVLCSVFCVLCCVLCAVGCCSSSSSSSSSCSSCSSCCCCCCCCCCRTSINHVGAGGPSRSAA